MLNSNIILSTDSYKISMSKQYPFDTEIVYSYFESRGGKFDKILFYGLQYYIKKYMTGVVVTNQKIKEAKTVLKAHFGSGSVFDEQMWQHIVDNHGGKLPVKIKAVPEGMIVPNKNALFTIENTDPKCFNLTTHLETLLSKIWASIAVATQSWYMKQMILRSLEKSGTPDKISFALHDFGFRGVSSEESAEILGSAHLINFLGSDTLGALSPIFNEYGKGFSNMSDEEIASSMPCFSIPAMEHSTCTSHGKENEAKSYENMLDKYPTGIVACVSDSYNIFNACEHIWGEQLKDKVMNRNGTVVIRPDSLSAQETLPKLLDILSTKFGFSINSKGYKVLPPQIRMIWGDGIDYESLQPIIDAVMNAGFSADNVSYGSGGGLLQKLNRDSIKAAVKCSAIRRSGKWYDVWKDPIGQSDKASKRGRLELTVDNENRWRTVPEGTTSYPMLKTVFEDGILIKEYSFDEVKRNAASSSTT